MNIFMIPDIHAAIEDYYRPKVQKGVAYLDEFHDGWVQKINPDELQMEDGSLCICGHVFDDYFSRPEALLDANAFGFNLDDAGFYPANRNDEWQALERLWLDEVFWRTS